MPLSTLSILYCLTLHMQKISISMTCNKKNEDYLKDTFLYFKNSGKVDNVNIGFVRGEPNGQSFRTSFLILAVYKRQPLRRQLRSLGRSATVFVTSEVSRQGVTCTATKARLTTRLGTMIRMSALCLPDQRRARRS